MGCLTREPTRPASTDDWSEGIFGKTCTVSTAATPGLLRERKGGQLLTCCVLHRRTHRVRSAPAPSVEALQQLREDRVVVRGRSHQAMRRPEAGALGQDGFDWTPRSAAGWGRRSAGVMSPWLPSRSSVWADDRSSSATRHPGIYRRCSSSFTGPEGSTSDATQSGGLTGRPSPPWTPPL